MDPETNKNIDLDNMNEANEKDDRDPAINQNPVANVSEETEVSFTEKTLKIDDDSDTTIPINTIIGLDEGDNKDSPVVRPINGSEERKVPLTEKPINDESNATAIDKMSKAIGEIGIWQILILIVASIPSKMSAMWQQMAIIFVAPKTYFWCTELETNGTILNSTCYKNCSHYDYYSEFENTIISEWDLICGRAWLANLTQTVCMFGVLVGSAGYGFISDRYGRRPALVTAAMSQMICGIIMPFSPDYWTFTALRFIIGTSTAGLMVVSFVIILEIVGPNKRELMTGIYQIPIAMGEMVMPAFAYYLRSWDKFLLGIGIAQFIFVIYLFVIPETPKWLISVGRLEEASDMMKKAAKMNKLPTENMLQIAKEISEESNAKQDKTQTAKATYWDLVRIPSLRMKNFCSCVCWFILGLSFYGGNQYIGQTSSNTFLTIFLAGALQIPGLMLAGFLYKRFGRKNTMLAFCIVCAVSNGLLILPNKWFYVKLVAGAMAVSSAAGAFSAMYTFTSELFPTVVRNMAVGASSTASRVGSMLAPFVAGAGGAWVAPAIFVIAPLIAAIAVCFLPETKGTKLLDHLNEC